MKALSLPIIAAVALALACLNYLWLAGGNAGWIAEGNRELVKNLSLGLAFVIFAVGAFFAARQAPDHWFQTAALTGALSGGLGFVLILLSSALLARGQLFHDGVRIGNVALTLLCVLGGGALLAVGIGFVTRLLVGPRGA